VFNWNNLGFLYLHHSDYELASESFTRAQTLDPDNAVSWIGQALLRSITGLESEAQELLAYAITLNPTKVQKCSNLLQVS
jgi:superkiller protein 3